MTNVESLNLSIKDSFLSKSQCRQAVIHFLLCSFQYKKFTFKLSNIYKKLITTYIIMYAFAISYMQVYKECICIQLACIKFLLLNFFCRNIFEC